jgi:glucokinase
MSVVVVDAGGTYLRVGVADDTGELRAYRRRRIPRSQSDSDCESVWESILAAIEDCIADLGRDAESGDAIVVAVPGPVVDGCRLVAAPTITGGQNSIPDIARLLAARTGRRVYLLNDVSAAAWYIGERLSADRFFVVTVSSGIGGKLFDRRHVERIMDGTQYAGEIGHIVVDTSSDAPLCDCGGRGHLGAISSGRGAERLARRLARADGSRFRASAIARKSDTEPELITNEEHLIPAALEGDEWALSVVERSARPLAQVLSGLIASVGLDRIVVIGGFAQQLGAVYKSVLCTHMSELLSAQAFSFSANDRIDVWDEVPEVCLAGAGAFYRSQCVG